MMPKYAQGNQLVPGNVRANAEKLHLAQKPGIIFQSPEILNNKTNFLIFMGIVVLPLLEMLH